MDLQFIFTVDGKAFDGQMDMVDYARKLSALVGGLMEVKTTQAQNLEVLISDLRQIQREGNLKSIHAVVTDRG